MCPGYREPSASLAVGVAAHHRAAFATLHFFKSEPAHDLRYALAAVRVLPIGFDAEKLPDRLNFDVPFLALKRRL